MVKNYESLKSSTWQENVKAWKVMRAKNCESFASYEGKKL
jgi:hypothetical protein